MKFFTNFWRPFNKFLHKHRKFLQLLRDIEANQIKLDQEELAGNEIGMATAGKRDTWLRRIKMKMMKKPRGI